MPRAVLANLSALAFARALVRWDEWYYTKVPLFLVCMYYAALSRPQIDARVVGEMALLLALLCGYASFGHITNDFSDRAADRAAGKRKVLATLSEHRARMVVLAAGMVGVLPAIWFYFDRPDVIALIGAAYTLAALYSLPPARLKERGTLGLIAATLAQRTLPAVVVFEAMGVWDWTAAALCVLSTLIGLRYILVHQVLDAPNDAHAGIRTFGTEHDVHLLRLLINRIVFPLELASLGAAVLTMGAAVSPSIWAFAGLYAVWFEVLRRRIKRLGVSTSPTSYELLSDLYTVYWPLLLAMVLSAREPVLLAVLALNVLLLFPAIRVLIGSTLQLFSATAAGQRGHEMAPVRSPAGSMAGGSPSIGPNACSPKDRKSWNELRRNEPCPCGSGKRYKHCHGSHA